MRDIEIALQGFDVEGLCLRVSVAEQVSIEHMSDDLNPVVVRWMCWGFERDGVELTEPQFEVLSKDVTAERLRKELPCQFHSSLTIVVDNDIEV